MAKRRNTGGTGEVKPDLTPMMDVVFQLITFFVMLMTLAKDEAAQRVRLPIARTAAILTDDQVPNSLNINVAYPEVNGKRSPVLLGWGVELDLSTPKGIDDFNKLICNQAALDRQRETQGGTYDKAKGLQTTLIVRVDRDVDYAVFRQIVDLCRAAGFRIFQLKAVEEEERRG